MMIKQFLLLLAVNMLSLSGFADSVTGRGPTNDMRSNNPGPRYSFAQLGQFKLNDSTLQVGEGGDAFEGELDDLPFFAGGIQQINGGSWIRYGWEAGAMLSWQADTVAAYVNNGTVKVSISNDFFMFGTSVGALIDVPLGRFARIFVSAGPSISFGSLRLKQQNGPEVSPQVVYNVNEHETEFGLGGYASAGLVIVPEKNFEVGLVIRESKLGLNFSGDDFESHYEGQQYLLTFGARL